MANKGLQFEHAVMYVAKSRIVSRNNDDEKDFLDASEKWSTIPDEIKRTAEKIVIDFGPKSIKNQQEYFKSFRKMSGGGEEPKTDILFVKDGIKYKCSMKWGKSFQLTSSGIDKSLTVFKQVLDKSLKECTGKSDQKSLGYVQSILEEIARKFENNKGTTDQPTAKRLLSDIKKSGGINEQLQNVLGSKQKPDSSILYHCFKKNLTRECMTGELLFGKSSDKAATHLFTENGIKAIDNEAVEEVMGIAGVRISLKGRGTDPKTGIRRNEIVIRYEV